MPFSAFADDAGFLGAYYSLRHAVGISGVAELRRAEPFASVSRFLHDRAPRVDVSITDITWASGRLSAAVQWVASSKWPGTAVIYGVYGNQSRAAADLPARASFFVGDAAMRTRVLRQRFPSFFLRFSTLSCLFVNASPAGLCDLAVTLAQRTEPNGDLSASTFGLASSGRFSTAPTSSWRQAASAMHVTATPPASLLSSMRVILTVPRGSTLARVWVVRRRPLVALMVAPPLPISSRQRPNPTQLKVATLLLHPFQTNLGSAPIPLYPKQL
jgi:hypothetical protein